LIEVEKSIPLLDADRATVWDNSCIAGDTQRISVVETKPAVMTDDPKRHLRPSVASKLVPWMVTEVPPEDGPDVGEMEVTEAVLPYVKLTVAAEYSVPPFKDTASSTVPGKLAAGDVHSISVDEMNFAAVLEVAPNLHRTLAGESAKLYPETKTTVPPAVGPEEGEMERGKGVDRSPNWTPFVVKSMELAETSSETEPPSDDDGDSHVRDVDERYVAGVATAEPNLQDIPLETKLEPVTVTIEPPSIEPAGG
jgi:hypothetical protein